MERFVAYYRVSTKRQGISGLGLDAQREAVRRFIGSRELLAEFTDVESGKRDDRPGLDQALRECRLRGAVLVIAKLDRLARNVAFLSKLMEAGNEFVAVDMPEANRLMIQIMAAMAEHERELISQRTKAALKAARDRGIRLGGRRAGHRIEDHSAVGRQRAAENRSRAARVRASEVAVIVDDIRKDGITSLQGIARELNARSIGASRGGRWSAGQVRRLVAQLG